MFVRVLTTRNMRRGLGDASDVLSLVSQASGIAVNTASAFKGSPKEPKAPAAPTASGGSIASAFSSPATMIVGGVAVLALGLAIGRG